MAGYYANQCGVYPRAKRSSDSFSADSRRDLFASKISFYEQMPACHFSTRCIVRACGDWGNNTKCLIRLPILAGRGGRGIRPPSCFL